MCPYPEPSSSSLALEYLTPCSVASDPLHPEGRLPALPPHRTYSLSVPLVCVSCGHSASSLGSEPLSPEHFRVPSLCPGLHELSLQILPAAVSTLYVHILTLALASISLLPKLTPASYLSLHLPYTSIPNHLPRHYSPPAICPETCCVPLAHSGGLAGAPWGL